MRRDLFTEDHEAFRELARDFVEKEVARLIRSGEN
jgi:acyl-CoA dehydrogenase